MALREAAESLWGEDGYDKYRRALDAAHAFARASNAPPGVDVFRWLSEQHTALVFADNDRKKALASIPVK